LQLRRRPGAAAALLRPTRIFAALGSKRTKARLAARAGAYQNFPANRGDSRWQIPHVVTAQRAELAGGRELTTRHLQQLRPALEHLDATPCLFDPAAVPNAMEPKVWRPKADWAKRGEMTRICLETLRQAPAPFCNRDIALALMTARGMDTDNDRLVKLIAKRVGCCLRGQLQHMRKPNDE
jgi:hypothetical protein